MSDVIHQTTTNITSDKFCINFSMLQIYNSPMHGVVDECRKSSRSKSETERTRKRAPLDISMIIHIQSRSRSIGFWLKTFGTILQPNIHITR